MPGEDKILVTSTDSRIRLYDLRDLSLVCKYRGYTNVSSQIRACFSPDGRLALFDLKLKHSQSESGYTVGMAAFSYNTTGIESVGSGLMD